jgi:DNA-binding LacI/PurR family transcriptional regulator
MIEGDHTMEGGIEAFNKLLRVDPLPTAVMCSNDVTAIGVIRQAYERGISVPQQLSVIGFDDVHLAQFITPPLTTIRMSQSELAQLAFRALLSDVERESPSENGTEYVLQTNLVLRSSTAQAPVSH